MHEGKWQDDFLPYTLGDGIALQVLRWAVLSPIDELYFVRSKSWRLIFNYLKEIGVYQVLKKVRSRRDEYLRNKKFLSIGLAIEAKNTADERLVVFFAFCHPMCVDELVLPTEFIIPIPDLDKLGIVDKHALLFSDVRGVLDIPELLLSMAGWSAYSGMPLDACPNFSEEVFNTQVSGVFSGIDWDKAQVFSRDSFQSFKPKHRTKIKSITADKLSAAIIGYGQYAKTNIIPNIKANLEVKKIYELDPLQIPSNRRDIEWSTSAVIESHDEFDAYFIASFHHMHAPAAMCAIEKGAVAVVEKPVVVDLGQLNALVASVSKHQGKVYSCYHKRFSPFNAFAKKDLRIKKGEPINYHCIVHEVPLPKKHWYNWPNSHTRLVSNGCHWIDHFLFLNDYPEYTAIDGFVASDGTINCSVLAENGAFFSMVLTDAGSSRIGVQDYIELRANGVTVSIQNGTKYF
ncbi:MAG: Gfo/Idh/MocA family oxidoreductase, partial [Legionella sp.]|nr:Gfo/Idh/MocA family oxidoreductase [Legionella sp.]